MSTSRPAGLKKRKGPEGLGENMINQTLRNRYTLTAHKALSTDYGSGLSGSLWPQSVQSAQKIR